MTNLESRLRGRSWAAVGVLAAASAAWFISGGRSTVAQHPVSIAEVSPQATAHAHSLSTAFRNAAEEVLPAVVSIQHSAPVARARRSSAPGEMRQFGGRRMPPGMQDLDPLLKRFFEQAPQGGDDEGEESSPGRASSGSGVIIDKSGVVLTNNHVVAGGGKVVVRLHDGREFEAAEVKTDPNTDLAVVKLKNASNLPTAKLGDSDGLQIGDWVLALGQPFGLTDTVTQGIISAKNRGIGITRHAEFLQTDAAINPGNSGGPLVNLNGEVIGINTAISSTSGGYQGIGFAVPVNVAKWVLPQLLKDGMVHRAFLGVGIQPLSQAVAEQLGMSVPSGALVTEVQPKSPAAEAGLQSQDVIVDLNGRTVASPQQLHALVGRSPLDAPVPLTVMRDGKKVTLQVKLREQPKGYGERVAADSTDEAQPEGESFQDFGLEVAPLNAEVAEKLGLKETTGVVIVSVEDGSPAAEAGLKTSEVITQVGRKPVKNVRDFRAAAKDSSLDKGVLVLVRSPEGSRYVVLKK